MSSEELKPCPFCGNSDAKDEMAIILVDLVYGACYQVECSCGARGSHGTYQEAIDSWNTRHDKMSKAVGDRVKDWAVYMINADKEHSFMAFIDQLTEDK